VQALGYALQQELMSRFRTAGTGLLIATEPQASDVVEVTDPGSAGGQTVLSLTITADVGINF